MVEMAVSAENMQKLSMLSNEDMSIVMGIVDQMVSRPIDVFNRLREEGIKNPMTEDEADDFVDSVRKERYATRSWVYEGKNLEHRTTYSQHNIL